VTGVILLSSNLLQIKNNSMKKLAATTLMEILPPDLQNNVRSPGDLQANSQFPRRSQKSWRRIPP
jgi:hypothetical protein